jgi:hypothetical protein
MPDIVGTDDYDSARVDGDRTDMASGRQDRPGRRAPRDSLGGRVNAIEVQEAMRTAGEKVLEFSSAISAIGDAAARAAQSLRKVEDALYGLGEARRVYERAPRQTPRRLGRGAAMKRCHRKRDRK